MTTTHRSHTDTLSGEPDAHVVSRHLQVAIRGLLVVAVIATILLLIFYRPAAYLAAIPIPVLYIVLLVVNYYERRSRASKLRHSGQTKLSQEEIDVDVEAAGLATALRVGGTLALGTFIIAATLFDVAHVGFVAVVALLLAIFLGLPYWPLIVSEGEREERDKVTRKTRLPNEF